MFAQFKHCLTDDTIYFVRAPDLRVILCCHESIKMIMECLRMIMACFWLVARLVLAPQGQTNYVSFILKQAIVILYFFVWLPASHWASSGKQKQIRSVQRNVSNSNITVPRIMGLTKQSPAGYVCFYVVARLALVVVLLVAIVYVL